MESNERDTPQAFEITFQELFERFGVKEIVIPPNRRGFSMNSQEHAWVCMPDAVTQTLVRGVDVSPQSLGLIYGDINDGRLILRRGQQRLTLLFLLHCYAADKARVPQAKRAFLKRFRCCIHPDVEAYCARLVKRTTAEALFRERKEEAFRRALEAFQRSLLVEAEGEAEEEDWGSVGFAKEEHPTIRVMETWLSDFDATFENPSSLWKALTEERRITFTFLPLKPSRYAAAYYLRLHCRGRPLTLFDVFQGELETHLRKMQVPEAERTALFSDLNTAWLRQFWPYCLDLEPNAPSVERTFLEYLRFIVTIGCWRRGRLAPEAWKDAEDLRFALSDFFFPAICRPFDATDPDNLRSIEADFAAQAVRALQLLRSSLDCWRSAPVQAVGGPQAFLATFLSRTAAPGKIAFRSRGGSDPLATCLNGDATTVCLLFLHAIIQSLEVGWEGERSVQRLRVVHKLLKASPTLTKGKHLPAIVAQIEHLIKTGKFAEAPLGFTREAYEAEL